MTSFRAYYAQQAERFFELGEVEWEAARDAWYDDTWFNFRSPEFRREDKIIYKSKMGSLELQCGGCNDAHLQEILAKCSNGEGITTRQTGKSAAFCMLIDGIHDFSESEAAKPIVQQSFAAVGRLIAFYVTNSHLLKERPGS